MPEAGDCRLWSEKFKRVIRVHVSRCKLVDFADCKVFKLLTSQADRQGLATHQFYQ